MALTYTFVEDSVLGNWSGRLYNILLDSSYPTGGYAIAPTRIKLGKTILGVQILAVNAAGSGIVQISWDYANSKLMAFRVATVTPAGTAIFTGSALATHSHSLWVATGATDATGARVNAASNSLAMNNAAAAIAGIPAASGAAGGVVDATGGTPAGTVAITGTATGQIAFAQVSNGVNLAAVTVRCLFIGR